MQASVKKATNAVLELQKNSLRAWSFKRAVTIRTYRDYHPIPVPLNLLSQLFLALCRNSTHYNDLEDETIDKKVGYYFGLLIISFEINK